MWTVLSTCWCAFWDIMSESCCCFVSLKQNSYMRRKTHLYETRLTARQHWQLSWDWVEKWSRSSQTATPAPLLAFCTKPKCQNLHRDLDILNSRLSSLGFFSQILWKGLLPIACGIFWRTSSKTKCQESDQLLCLCWNLPQMTFGISLSETKHKWLYQTSPQILDVNSYLPYHHIMMIHPADDGGCFT